MAEIVGSAVASEAVSRLSSFLSGDKTSHESAEDKAERLEMAVLKIRSVVAVSEDFHISHLPLLQWKAKLKRIAEEGDDLLHVHKKQALECNRVSDGTGGNTSISQYLIQAAKRFVPFYHKEGDDELSDNTLRRFERLAEGADSFFRLVESGGHPNKSVYLPSLTRSLLAGDSVEFSIQRRSGDDLIMLWPWLDPDAEMSGLMACMCVSREDEVMWQKSFKMCVLFRLSEASNILAIALRCLDVLSPQFDAASAAIRGLLTETIGGSADRSGLSERLMWCCQRIQSYHRNDCELSVVDDSHRDAILLPHSVLRLTTFCYGSPPINTKDGLPIEVDCHVPASVLPEKHSSQLERVGQDVFMKLSPKVTDSFYDDGRQALHYKRQIWCPQGHKGRCIVQLLQLFHLMEYSGTPSRRRRRRTAKRKPQSISKSQRIAEASLVSW